MISIVALIFMSLGLFFVLVAAIGVVKFRDVYTRLHAASKGATFGFCFIIFGAALLSGDPGDMAKAILAIIFQFLTAPLTGHMIARVAMRRGIRPILHPGGDA